MAISDSRIFVQLVFFELMRRRARIPLKSYMRRAADDPLTGAGEKAAFNRQALFWPKAGWRPPEGCKSRAYTFGVKRPKAHC